MPRKVAVFVILLLLTVMTISAGSLREQPAAANASIRSQKILSNGHQQERIQPPWPDSLNVRFVGNWPFGSCSVIAYDSMRNHIFCGSGGGVFVLDVTNSDNPYELSESIHTRGVVKGLVYQNNNLYIACGVAGVEIWDVSDSLRPNRLGLSRISGNAYDVAILGNNMYVVDQVAEEESLIRVFDISNAAFPVELNSFEPSNSVYRTVAYGEYLYMAGDYGLTILTVSYTHLRAHET